MMKAKKWRVFVIALIISAALVGLLVMGAKSHKQKDKEIASPDQAIDEDKISGDTAKAEQEIISKDVKLYWKKLDTPMDVTVFLADGNSAIPYMEVDDFVEMRNKMAEIENRECVITDCRKDGDKVVMVRDNASECVLDFAASTIYFDNYDKFIQHGYTDALVCAVWRHPTFDNGKPKYFEQVGNAINRNGEPVTLNLADYDIEMIKQDSHYLIPVKTMCDILISDMTNFIVYNGADLFVNDSSFSQYENEEYFSAAGETRSSELAKYTYDEFAFAMDFYYGQKKEQNISDFRSYMHLLGLDETLMSENPGDSSYAFFTLVNRYLGGLHNVAYAPSFLVESEEAFLEKYDVDGLKNPTTYADNPLYIYSNAREKYHQPFVEDYPAYEEVGDTIILSFNGFSFPDLDEVDYYEKTMTKDDLWSVYNQRQDLIGLLQYAHSRVADPDSKIKNVVIDLSCNGGGEVDAGICLLSWIMGEAPVSLKDKATGAETTTYYRYDANFDGVFDEKDTLEYYGVNAYCIVSPTTFSCANMVACALKESQKAILLGSTTGGGTCAILPFCTADGVIMNISGRLEISVVKNGTYYHVDRGVDPDYRISNMETMFNRQKLVDYIHSIP